MVIGRYDWSEIALRPSLSRTRVGRIDLDRVKSIVRARNLKITSNRRLMECITFKPIKGKGK